MIGMLFQAGAALHMAGAAARMGQCLGCVFEGNEAQVSCTQHMSVVDDDILCAERSSNVHADRGHDGHVHTVLVPEQHSERGMY